VIGVYLSKRFDIGMTIDVSASSGSTAVQVVGTAVAIR
jgi:hypothetical protein